MSDSPMQLDAEAYEHLRDVIGACFNPPDEDGAEEAILSQAVQSARDFIAAQPCTCRPEVVADEDAYDACERCKVLGRCGDKAVAR